MIIADPISAKANAYEKSRTGLPVTLYITAAQKVTLRTGSVREGPFSRTFKDQCGFAEDADIIVNVTIQEAQELGIRDLSALRKFTKIEFDKRQFTVSAMRRKTKVLDTFLWYEIGGKKA